MLKTILRTTLIIALLGGFGYTLYYLWQKEQEVPVVHETVQPVVTDIIKKTVATGKIAPEREVAIKSRVSGIIDQVYVEPGQRIRAGDQVARIRIVPDMVNLNNAENRVKLAHIALDNAKADSERNQKLLANKVISTAEMQPFVLALRNAEQELTAAENNLQLIREGAKKGDSGNTLVRATATGMVLDVPLKEGSSVIESNTFNEGTTIALVADMGDMIFEGKIDESEVGKIKEGMDLLITVGAIEGQTYNAKLDHIAPKGVEENGAVQFKIKARVQLKEGAFIRSGYSANADIVLQRRDSVLAIEESVLIFNQKGDSAFVEVETKPQIFEKRQVKTGLSDGINIEILDGVKKEDKVKRQK
jgi:HlyD family secretion protein